MCVSACVGVCVGVSKPSSLLTLTRGSGFFFNPLPPTLTNLRQICGGHIKAKTLCLNLMFLLFEATNKKILTLLIILSISIARGRRQCYNAPQEKS